MRTTVVPAVNRFSVRCFGRVQVRQKNSYASIVWMSCTWYERCVAAADNGAAVLCVALINMKTDRRPNAGMEIRGSSVVVQLRILACNAPRVSRHSSRQCGSRENLLNLNYSLLTSATLLPFFNSQLVICLSEPG